MSCHLPGQQDIQGTYMEVPVIAWLVENRLTPEHAEAEIARVWNEILCHHFNIADGFSTGPELQFGKERADLFAAHLVLQIEVGRLCEERFLILEYKQPGDETQGEIWRNGAQRLQGYFEEIPTSRPRKFGAIAARKTVRFYEWVNGTLVDFENNSSVYYLDRQSQDVTRVFGLIKTTA